jgi:D-beta-D-heptose 7-phosphate kinase/D-beta-D-heptose 1-phosphate adenosyltransferase
MNRSRAKQIVEAFSGKYVVVVGDIMLDEYVWGSVNRISPEAPVMVVDAARYTQVPGGAGNVVNNLCSLGATGAICGVVGEDEAARYLIEALQAEGAGTSGLIVAGDRPTTRKTRIIAHSQQVVRVDHEKRGALSADVAARLIETIDRIAAKADALLVSDYQKGVVSPSVLAACCRHAKNGKPVTGNLKPKAIAGGCPLTVLTLNLAEAAQSLGVDSLESNEEVADAGRKLLAISGAQHVLITRGAAGLTLCSAANRDHPAHVPARPVAVYDVAGAGDTVISALTLSLASGATPIEAVTLANHAGAEAVKKVGVATVTAAEILSSFS